MKVANKLRKRNRLLVEFREQFQLSQAAAAKLCDVRHVSWNALELMRDDVCPSHVEKIADCIGAHPASLMPSTASRWPVVFSDIDVSNVLCEDYDPDRESLENQMERVLNTLSYREREIIKLRYGIGVDGDTYTLEEVGKIFQCPRERVRQVEAKALRKLQHPVRARQLNGFL